MQKLKLKVSQELQPKSQAMTLSIKGGFSFCVSLEVQGWPPAVRNGPDVDNWLGKKARQEIKSLPCYFVPKRLKGRKLSEDAKGERTFS